MHRKKNKGYIGCLLFIIIIFIVVGCGNKEDKEVKLKELDLKDTKKKEKPLEEDQKQSKKEEQSKIYVYVCGAVQSPGVYRVPSDSRLYEALAAAGGMNEQADKAYLNQAEVLVDEQRIYVPTVEETSTQIALEPTEKAGEKDGRIDLNNASKEELMTLPGIGESKANAILAYRETKGGFTATEDIKQIEGIKDGVFEKIKDMIVV